MFTGIIQGLGEVTATAPRAGEVKLTIEALFDWDGDLVIGESIAVSGACLTVTEAWGRSFSAFVSMESISRTIMKDFRSGTKVNLERALRLSDRLGGHLVSGHVDGLGLIREKRPVGSSLYFSFGVDKSLTRYIIEKGSVTIDGISLTVNEVGSDYFTINVIPHTASITSLGFKKAGDYVNLETDLIGKYVAKLLGRDREGSSIDENFLAEHGFL